jgi:TolA-binding protein
MTCKEFNRLFYADFGRGCSVEARAAADRHAVGCALCAAKLGQKYAVAAAMGVAVPRLRREREARAARRRVSALIALGIVASTAFVLSRGALSRIAAFAVATHRSGDAALGVESASLASPPAYMPVPGASGEPIAVEAMARARAESEASDRALADAALAAAPDPSKLVPGSFEEALHLYRTGRFKLAALAFHSIVPPTVEASMWAARSVRASGDYGAAALLFSEVAAAYSRSPIADDALLEVGRCYRATGHYEMARKWLRALRSVPSHTARAQDELDGIERDIRLAKKRAEQAEHHAPVLAPRGIDPRSKYE